MSLAVIDDSQQVLDLTEEEQTELALCEAVIEKGRRTFLEVGGALMTIQEKRLYRANHATFEAYCREKWEISRTYAYEMITAFGITENVLNSGHSDLPAPANPAQALALRNVPEEEQPEVYREAVTTAPEGRVTAAHVQAVADRHTGKEAEREARAEAEKEAQAEALVSGFMDAPPAGGEAEQAIPIDYPTSLALGRSLSLNVLKGEIGPPILLNRKLWVTERINGSLYECLCVTEMDGWIDRTQKKPLHYTQRDASIEAGERDESDVAGLKVVWTSAPRDADCFYVLTGERRTFQFVSRSQEAKVSPAPKPDRPEPEPVVQQKPEPEPESRSGPSPYSIPLGNTGALNPDTRSDIEKIHAALSCKLDFGVLVSCRPEDDFEVMDEDAFVTYWQEFLGNVRQALNDERERAALLQSKLQAHTGSGLLVTGKDYELLTALAARKRPGQDEEMTAAEYLSLIIEQRAAAAGIVLDAGV